MASFDLSNLPEPLPAPEDTPQGTPETSDGDKAPIVAPSADEKTSQENYDDFSEPEKNVDHHDIVKNLRDTSAAYMGFDPSVHAANADGSPKFKVDGTYALKRGRKSGTGQSAPRNPETSALPRVETGENNQTAESAAPKIDYTALGKVYAGLFFGGTASLIGPEWMPADKDEQKRVEVAFSAWAKSTGASDLPPGWALVITLGMYSASRLQHQNTASKFQRLKEKAWLGFVWIKNKVRK